MSTGMIVKFKNLKYSQLPPSPAQDKPFSNIWRKALLLMRAQGHGMNWQTCTKCHLWRRYSSLVTILWTQATQWIVYAPYSPKDRVKATATQSPDSVCLQLWDPPAPFPVTVFTTNWGQKILFLGTLFRTVGRTLDKCILGRLAAGTWRK